MKEYQIKAPAKINLGLRILGRRKDGYHELLSIMVPISLFDNLYLSSSARAGTRLDCQGRGDLPADTRNLAFRAAQSFQEKTGIREGLHIRLIKNIPIAAGLGGGSSDAAATLLALNDMYGHPLKIEELHQLALELGADVPFFLYSRPALARGIGEILDPIENWVKNWYVTITPPLQISTVWVYSQLNLELTSNTDEYIFSLFNTKSIDISQVLVNDLEQVTLNRFPVIDTIKKRLADAGAEGAIMSGSGPTVFGIFSTKERAQKATDSLIKQELGDIFMVTDWERFSSSK